jgi:hypothetical protein
MQQTDISSKPQSSRSWLGHVQGASALLELRGASQMHTALGRQIFEHLRSQILLRCSLMRRQTPSTIITLSEECKRFRTSSADELASISNEIGQLRSERPFRPHPLDSECLDRDIIRRCLSLGFKLEAWRSQTTAVPCPGRAGVQVSERKASGECRNVSGDSQAVGLLNRHRGLVILVEELAITRLLNLKRKAIATTAEVIQLQDLRHNIIQQVDKICASVPQLIGSGNLESARSLLWPLYMAAQLDPATVRCNSTTREWMLARLRFIGYEAGIRQSLFLVEVLSKREEVSDLLGGSHVGGAECTAEAVPLAESCSAWLRSITN